MANRKRQYRDLDEILEFITNDNADSNDEDLIDDDSELEGEWDLMKKKISPSANNHEPSNTGTFVNNVNDDIEFIDENELIDNVIEANNQAENEVSRGGRTGNGRRGGDVRTRAGPVKKKRARPCARKRSTWTVWEGSNVDVV